MNEEERQVARELGIDSEDEDLDHKLSMNSSHDFADHENIKPNSMLNQILVATRLQGEDGTRNPMAE